MSGFVYKMNGWTPSLILACIVTIGAFVIMAVAPESNVVNVVVGWVSIIIAGFFGNALVEKEKTRSDASTKLNDDANTRNADANTRHNETNNR